MSKGIVGLSNIGNTCYGNATLQALRHQVDFTIFLLQNNHEEILKDRPQSEKTRLLESYVKLLRQLWTSETGYEKTREFWGYMVPAAIRAGVDHFRMPVAHDAHEFLVFLLDQFHEALADEVDITIKTDPSNTETYNALKFWKQTFEKSYSPLVELVFSLVRKSVQCQTCKKESVSWETCNMSKVSVTKGDSGNLLDLMRKEEDGEEIEEYFCEGCATHRKAVIHRNYWRLGNWVIVVLKRNENNGRRINTHVEIPLTTSFDTLFHSASQEPSKQNKYELFATIHHHGSAGGGHYTSHAKHPVTGRWAHFDDESAREVETPSLDASTYIVMYRCVR